MKKYRLTDKYIELPNGTKFYQIEALIDFGSIKKGSLGGYIESESNLSHSGNCWVYGDAQVYGSAWVYGNAQVYGNARVDNGKWDKSPLQIQGSKYFVNMSGENTLRMGCQNHKLKKWLKHGEEIAEECNELDLWPEYERYLKLAVEMYQPELLMVDDTA